jgi:hypothetical protein
MANDVFKLSSDLEVSLFTYASDVFIWGVTRWDDGDKWNNGTAVQSWVDFSGSIASVEISNGTYIEQGLTRPEPATATIVFQDANYDPFNNITVRTGTPIRIRIRPNPDTDPTTWVTLFQGKIDNASASYNEYFTNTVTLSCVTNLRDYLNFSIIDGFITTNISQYAWNFIDDMAAFFTENGVIYNTALDGYILEGIDTLDPVNVGEVMNQLLDANLGALVYQPITSNPFNLAYYYLQEELGNIDTATSVLDFEASASANSLRASFYDLTIGYDTEQIVNEVKLETVSGYGPIVRKNDNSVQLYGSLASEILTRHYDDIDAETWISQVTLSEPRRRVLDISASVINRDGTVNENLLREPMNVCNVSISNANLTLDENYYITRVNYSLTPDQWLTSMELWKGR